MLSRKLSGLSRLNMEILDYRCVELGDWWRAEDICSPFTRIYMVFGGVGYLRWQNREMTMTAGNIYVVPAGTRFSYRCEAGFSKVYFHVSVPLPNRYDLMETAADCMCFPDPETVAFARENFRSERLADMMRLRAELYRILFLCMEGDTQLLPGACSETVAEAMEYIQRNLSAGLDAELVARELGISAEKLRKAFRKEAGVPVGKYIRDRVLNRAELEVRRGEFSVKEISEMLGFSDQFYFSRCFSENFGLSPVKYRKKIKPEQ